MTIENTIKENAKLAAAWSCDYHKVEFREAVQSACDKLANEYLEQHKSGLITWGELGRQLEKLHDEQVKLYKIINNM